jgi:hypothetical protein
VFYYHVHIFIMCDVSIFFIIKGNQILGAQTTLPHMYKFYTRLLEGSDNGYWFYDNLYAMENIESIMCIDHPN